MHDILLGKKPLALSAQFHAFAKKTEQDIGNPLDDVVNIKVINCEYRAVIHLFALMSNTADLT